MEYRLIRSRRKSVGIEVHPNGEIVVRAPLRTSLHEIERIVESKHAWIKAHLAIAAEREKEAKSEPPLSQEEIQKLAEEALRVIPERVRYYAPLVGVTYGRITIRNQRTRWGSCSSKGNLNFNCLLMLAPPEVLDSVVVHELCHRKEMNHSARFYQEVLRVCPNYRECEKWLKTKGPAILQRMQ